MPALTPPLLPAAVYIIAEPFAPWLWPFLAILGILCQLAAARFHSHLLLCAGCALTLCGSAAENDLTLFAGDIMAVLILWRHLQKKRKKKGP